ncbi:hypothetical protein JCM5350_001928 [Sporobolomyces pararoseus]
MSSKFISSLPEEILDQIFSSNLHPHDLAVLCRVTKQFNIIVKSLLYRSITLCSIEQAEKFKRNDSGDAQLVESILITEKEDAWEIHDTIRMYDTMAKLSDTEKRQKESGLVKKVVEGEIDDTSQIKQLFVHQVLEDADVLWSDEFSVDYQTFANLKDLSIVRHLGGSQVLSGFLQRRYLPNLRRLALCDVAKLRRCSIPIQASANSLFSPFTTDLNGNPLVRIVPVVYGEDLGFLERTIKDMTLELLVSPSFGSLSQCPSLLHLAVFDHNTPLLSFDKYAAGFFVSDSTSDQEIADVFHQLRAIATNFSAYSLKYLTLPSSLEGQLSVLQNQILSDLTNLGVSVHFDGDSGTVIAPPSFFEFRQKEEDQEEEARRKEEEMRGADGK